MATHSYKCPRCSTLNTPRYLSVGVDPMLTWYVCRNNDCRHSYRCTANADGSYRKVTAESPYNTPQKEAA